MSPGPSRIHQEIVGELFGGDGVRARRRPGSRVRRFAETRGASSPGVLPSVTIGWARVLAYPGA